MAIAEAPPLIRLGARLSRVGLKEPSEGITILPRPSEPELLGEEVLYTQGNFSRVRRYYRGWHSELGGVFTAKGIQGKETIVERDVIKPVRTFTVEAKTNGHIPLNSHRLWSYLTKILTLF